MTTAIGNTERGVIETSPEFRLDTSPEKPPLSPSPPSGETEKNFKANETLQRATQPNLQALEQLAAAKTAEEIFPLVRDRFKLKVEALKATGVSIEEFSQQVLKHMRKTRNIGCDDKDELKNSITQLYDTLVTLVIKSFKKHSSSDLGIQLFELQKETGFSLWGVFILKKQLQHDEQLLQHAFHQGPAQMETLYWNVVIPHFQKIFPYLDQAPQNQSILCQECVTQIIDILKLCSKTFPTYTTDYNPWNQMLPLVVKYSAEQEAELFAEEYVKALFGNGSILEAVEGFCQLAEHSASHNPYQAFKLLKIAEKFVNNHLWTFPWPFNNSATEHKREQALARIEASRNKITTLNMTE